MVVAGPNGSGERKEDEMTTEIHDVSTLTEDIADHLFDMGLDAEACTTGNDDGNFVHVADANGRKFIIKVEEVLVKCGHGEWAHLCEATH